MTEKIIEILLICLILAIDVSIISFTYGISKIKIPFLSSLFTSLINLVFASIGVLICFFVSNLFNSLILDYISIALLFLTGCSNLILQIRKQKVFDTKADKNNDKILSLKESLILGIILCPDGFSASLSFGKDVFSIILFLSLFFITTLFSISVFSLIGFKISRKINLNLCYLSSLSLITFSIVKLILLLV